MTTTDIAPAPTTTYVNKNLKKPDDAGHKKFLEDLNQKIDLLKKQNVSSCHHHHLFFSLLFIQNTRVVLLLGYCQGQD